MLSHQMQRASEVCAFQAITLVSFRCTDPCWHMSETIDVPTLEEAFITQGLPQSRRRGISSQRRGSEA